MDELLTIINEKATAYWNETADEQEQITSIPTAVVDFVVEYAIGNCHFPAHFTDDEIVAVLTKYKSTLAMACVDVYAKAGTEGEKSHNENGISRTYDSSWISESLLSKLPNYVSCVV